MAVYYLNRLGCAVRPKNIVNGAPTIGLKVVGPPALVAASTWGVGVSVLLSVRFLPNYISLFFYVSGDSAVAFAAVISFCSGLGDLTVLIISWID